MIKPRTRLFGVTSTRRAKGHARRQLAITSVYVHRESRPESPRAVGDTLWPRGVADVRRLSRLNRGLHLLLTASLEPSTGYN
jgi:hypothetical protein